MLSLKLEKGISTRDVNERLLCSKIAKTEDILNWRKSTRKALVPFIFVPDCLRGVSIATVSLLIEDYYRGNFPTKFIVLSSRWDSTLHVEVELASSIGHVVRILLLKFWVESCDYGDLNVVLSGENGRCEVNVEIHPWLLWSIVTYRSDAVGVIRIRVARIVVQRDDKANNDSYYECNVKQTDFLAAYYLVLLRSTQICSKLCCLVLKYSPSTALTVVGFLHQDVVCHASYRTHVKSVGRPTHHHDAESNSNSYNPYNSFKRKDVSSRFLSRSLGQARSCLLVHSGRGE